MFLNAITHIPNTTYQGILFQKPGSSKPSTISADYQKQTKLILDYLIEHFHLIDIPLSPGITDARPFDWQGFKIKTAYTYSFPITDFESLEKKFSQDLRRKLKNKSETSETFKQSSETKQLTQFILDSYKKHNTSPAIPANLIQIFMDHCLEKNIGRFFYHYIDDKPVAGIFILLDEKTVYALFSGISKSRRNEIGNELLHAFVLNQPEFVGKNFDFLGANNPDLEQFKRSFGGELAPYFKVSFTRNTTINSLFYTRSKIQLAKRKFRSFY